MDEPLTIQKIETDQDTDFESLYKSGIRKLQQLSGNTWTDYNEHDPGVTILENLCYALTELYSRTEIPIQDLLTRKNGKFAANENALYGAGDILVNAPLTPGDYTKIIVDRIKEVKNAWIIPYYGSNPETHDNIGITGMYKVLIDLKDDIPVNEYTQKKVLDDATQLLENNRMLTELFPLIKILDPISLYVSFNLYLNESVKPEETLALILFNLVNFMKPDIQSFSYDEMTAFGYTADQIFEGPKLRNGFIPDTQLTEKPAIIYTDVLLKLIIEVPGVMSASSVSLNPAAPPFPLQNPVPNERLQKRYKAFAHTTNKEPQGTYPVLEDESILLNLPQSLDTIKIFVKQAPCYYNKNLVISLYNQLRSKKKANGSFIFHPEEENSERSVGRYVNPAAYYSMQNEFPAIYGIGKEKLGKRITEERKAQALQLKSYLLFFEQILADFMVQMDSIDDLFSIKKQERTYFFQPLYSVPDAPALLKGFNGDPDNVYNSEGGTTYLNDCNNFKANEENEYIVGLKNLYEKTDPFTTRRNSFLDHLLARFNFEIHPSPTIADSVYNETAMTEMEIKQEILNNIIEITSFRGHVAPIDSTTGAESEYHKSLGIFLHALSGIKYGNPERVLSGTYAILHPVLHTDNLTIFIQENPTRVNVNYTYKNFLNVIRAGIFSSNYETEAGEHEQTLYLTAGTSKFQLFKFAKGQTEDTTTAINLIAAFTKDFLSIFLSYENIYLIEHILLKPLNTEEKFVCINYPKEIPSAEPMTYDALMQQPYQQGQHQDPAVWTVMDEVCIHQDFYSSRISIVIPLSAIGKLQADKAYINYFNSLMVNNLPAHIYLDVLWLEEAPYTEFIDLYLNFVTDKLDAKEKLSLFFIRQEASRDLTNEI
jgi:hypothetical protein